MVKNLITFLESRGGINSNKICLDGNHFNAEYIEDTTDLIAFHPLKVFYVYKRDDIQTIDVQDEKGEIHVGFNPDLFIPHNNNLKRDYQRYLKSKN